MKKIIPDNPKIGNELVQSIRVGHFIDLKGLMNNILSKHARRDVSFKHPEQLLCFDNIIKNSIFLTNNHVVTFFSLLTHYI